MMVFDMVVGMAVVAGLTEVMKRTKLVATRLLPLVALVIGIVSFYFFGNATTDINILNGVVVSLMTMGLWSGTKATIE